MNCGDRVNPPWVCDVTLKYTRRLVTVTAVIMFCDVLCNRVSILSQTRWSLAWLLQFSLFMFRVVIAVLCCMHFTCGYDRLSVTVTILMRDVRSVAMGTHRPWCHRRTDWSCNVGFKLALLPNGGTAFVLSSKLPQSNNKGITVCRCP